MTDKTLNEIKSELQRLSAADATVTLDDEFEPEAGKLIKLQLNDAYWHFLPKNLLELLKELPDAAGSEAIRTTVEAKAEFVWHGPAPKHSRDTSP